VWNLTPIWQLASTLPSTYLSIFILKIPLLDQNLSYEILPNMCCQNNLGDNYLWFWKHHWRFVRTFLWEVYQNHLGNTSIMSSLWNAHNALRIHNLVRKDRKTMSSNQRFWVFVLTRDNHLFPTTRKLLAAPTQGVFPQFCELGELSIIHKRTSPNFGKRLDRKVVFFWNSELYFGNMQEAWIKKKTPLIWMAALFFLGAGGGVPNWLKFTFHKNNSQPS
jgi:hypothetical protein